MLLNGKSLANTGSRRKADPAQPTANSALTQVLDWPQSSRNELNLRAPSLSESHLAIPICADVSLHVRLCLNYGLP